MPSAVVRASARAARARSSRPIARSAIVIGMTLPKSTNELSVVTRIGKRGWSAGGHTVFDSRTTTYMPMSPANSMSSDVIIAIIAMRVLAIGGTRSIGRRCGMARLAVVMGACRRP